MRLWWTILGVVFVLAGLLEGCSEEAAQRSDVPSPTVALASLGKLAYVRDGDVWVVDLDSGHERRLTSEGQNRRPRWSSDGQWLAVTKCETVDPTSSCGGLWVMRADGSEAHWVDEGVFLYEWSPTEGRLAYGKEGGLWVTDAAGSHQEQIVPPDYGVQALAWAPDGLRLTFEGWQEEPGATPPPNTTGEQGLWLVNPDGSGLTKLYAPYERSNLGPVSYLGSWSRDGLYLAFWQGPTISASLKADGAPLYAMEVAGGEPQLLAGSLSPFEGGVLCHDAFVSWSPAGLRGGRTKGNLLREEDGHSGRGW